MRAVVIGNSDDLDPGLVGHGLRRRGYEFTEWVREQHHSWPRVTSSGESVFDLGDVELILSLGSGWSTYWDDVADAVRAEQQLLSQAMASEIPVWGICFGAQQVAVACGAEVSRASSPEIGWHQVDAAREAAGTLTTDLLSTGTNDSPLRDGAAVCAGSWMQWHYDRFTVPHGATLLAHSAVGPQAFVMGRTLAVQFHPEATETIVRMWSEGSGLGELSAAGIDPETLIGLTRREISDAGARCERLVEWFCRHIARAV